MAEGFKIADAFVDVEVHYDENEARVAGEHAGRESGESFTRGVDGRLRDGRGRFVRTTEDVLGGNGGADAPADRSGRRWGSGLMRGLGRAVTGTAKALFTDKITSQLGGGLMSFAKSPVGLAALLALGASAGTMIASGIASTLAVAFGSGLGLGFIGLGAFLLRDEPAVIKGLERIKKSFLSVFGGAAKKHFLGPIVTALGIIDHLIKSIQPSIDAIFKALAPAIVPLARGFEGMIQNMMPGLVALMQAVGGTLGFEEPLMSFGAFLNKMFLALAKNWPAIMKSFLSFATDVGKVLTVLGTAFLWLATHYEAAKKIFLSIIAVSQPAITFLLAFTKAVMFLAQNLPGWFSSAWGAVTGFFSSVGATIGRWYTSTVGWLKGLGSAIVSFVGTVATWLGGLPGRIAGWLAQLPGIVGRAFTSAMDKMLYAVGYAIGTVIKMYVGLPRAIASALKFLWSAMSGAWVAVYNNVRTWTQRAVNGAVSWFRQLPGRAKAAVAALWSAMSGAFSAANANARHGASQAVTGAVSWFRQLPGRARSALAGVKGAVLGAFRGAGSWLFQAGKDLLAGLARGIGAAIGGVINAGRHAAGQIIDGIKGAFSIGSPSRVMADEVGRWLPPGITKGFQEAMPKEQAKINAMMPTVATGAVGSGTAPALSGGGGGGLTINGLTIQVPAGVTDPNAWARAAVAALYSRLKQYEREYA